MTMKVICKPVKFIVLTQTQPLRKNVLAIEYLGCCSSAISQLMLIIKLTSRWNFEGKTNVFNHLSYISWVDLMQTCSGGRYC